MFPLRKVKRMIQDIYNDFKKVVRLYNEKPFLPFWGEFFTVLQRLKKEMKQSNEAKIFFYETTSCTPVFYQPGDGRFCLQFPDFNMLLTQEEFIDNLLKGKFWPK